jgi:hypothetical protein
MNWRVGKSSGISRPPGMVGPNGYLCLLLHQNSAACARGFDTIGACGPTHLKSTRRSMSSESTPTADGATAQTHIAGPIVKPFVLHEQVN